MSDDIIDNESEHRFMVTREGHTAELTYRVNGKRFVLIHTGVPEELEGRGIGGELVRAAVHRAAREGLIIIPMCPYARQWLQKHSDVAAEAEIDWTAQS